VKTSEKELLMLIRQEKVKKTQKLPKFAIHRQTDCV